jgi:NAD(P)-dependent dehydrogenase (short-subunit alcohol dehydrogenase family)
MKNDTQTPPYGAAIIGAAGGVGSALCRHLSADGWQVVAGGRSHADVPVDATDPDSTKTFFDAAADRLARLDAVAVCVGSLLLKPAHRTSLDEWHDVMQTNLTSAFVVLREAVSRFGEAGGSIVLVSSAAARRGMMNHEAIAAAKAGVVGLTLAAAATYAPKDIRINCVAPGLTETPMTRHLTSHEASRKASLAMHPLGRLGTPEDVAGAMAWLMHPVQGWITGQVLGVDGGLATLTARPGR